MSDFRFGLVELLFIFGNMVELDFELFDHHHNSCTLIRTVVNLASLRQSSLCPNTVGNRTGESYVSQKNRHAEKNTICSYNLRVFIASNRSLPRLSIISLYRYFNNFIPHVVQELKIK